MPECIGDYVLIEILYHQEDFVVVAAGIGKYRKEAAQADDLLKSISNIPVKGGDDVLLPCSSS